MKSFFRKIIATLSLLFIITTIQGEALEKAPSNVKLEGNATGLVHIPGDDLFLFFENMLPGDSVKRVMVIKNEYEHPFELFLRAERVSEKEEFDLLNKINLTITYKDKGLYKGYASGEYDITENISLGVFQPGQEEILEAVAELDGPTTGNEYKNKYAEVKWIFTAVRSEEDDESTENPEQGDSEAPQGPDENQDGENIYPQEPNENEEGEKEDNEELNPDDALSPENPNSNENNNNNTEDDDNLNNSPQTGQDSLLKYIIIFITALNLFLIIRRKYLGRKN